MMTHTVFGIYKTDKELFIYLVMSHFPCKIDKIAFIDKLFQK